MVYSGEVIFHTDGGWLYFFKGPDHLPTSSFSLSPAAYPSLTLKTCFCECMASLTTELCAGFVQIEWLSFNPKLQKLFGLLYCPRPFAFMLFCSPAI